MLNHDDMTQLRELGRQAYESGNLSQAADLVAECLEGDADDGRCLERSGLIQYSTGHYRASVASLESASIRVPLGMAARVCLAHGYGRIGRHALSLDLLTDMVAAEGIAIPLLLQVGIGLDYLGRPDLAVQACRQAGQREPRYAQTWYDMGYYIGRAGGSDDHVEKLARRAIEIAPWNTRYRVGLAGLLLKHDRSDEAYELVQELDKSAIESISCVCCLRRVAGLYAQARDHRRVVIARTHLVLIESGDDAGHAC